MSGSIKFNNSGQIRTAGESDTCSLTIFGQPDNFNSSYLAVTASTNTNPRFECTAGDGTTKKLFSGRLDGSLVWDSKNIVRSVNGVNANASGNVTLGKGVYITQTWKSGTSWYRVWSDGYIEQGDTVTVRAEFQQYTFIKAFSNTNYTVTACGGTSNYGNTSASTKTRTTMKLWTSDDDSFNAGLMSFIACGY